MKPDVACGAGRCPDLPRKACVCLHCQQAHGRCQEGQDWMAGCEALAPGLPSRAQEEAAASGQRSHPLYPQGRQAEPETHILEGQEDGQDEPTEEEGHEQHEEHTLAGCEVELQGWAERQLQGPSGLDKAALARRLRPRRQAAFQCSPQNLAFLPIHSRCPPHTLLIVVTSPQPGIQARNLHPPCLPGPTGPRADLGLEAEDGDREADEGRDAQAQQHRRGVVVTAGPAGRGSASGQGFRSPPALLPGPPPSART